MDPDETLRALLSDAYAVLTADESTVTIQELAFAEKILNLDEWIRRGGGFPERWTTK